MMLHSKSKIGLATEAQTFNNDTPTPVEIHVELLALLGLKYYSLNSKFRGVGHITKAQDETVPSAFS